MNRRKFFKALGLIAGSVIVAPKSILNLFKPKPLVGELGSFSDVTLTIKDVQDARNLMKGNKIEPVLINGKKQYVFFANEDFHAIVKDE